MASERTGLGNQGIIITTGCFSTMAGRFASPQVVLPWIYSLLGGPLFLVGFLAPSVRFGALMAQLLVVPTLLKLHARKWAYITAMLVSASVLTIYATVLQKMDQGVSLVFFFIGLLFLGGSTGVAALSIQEVIAKTIPRDKVGRVLSLQVSVGGGVMLFVMLLGLLAFPDVDPNSHRLAMMFAAATASILAAACFVMVREPPSEHVKVTSAWSEIAEGWADVRNVHWFRRFMLVRVLFLSVGMATPFYSIHAAIEFSRTAHSLTAIVVASGVTSLFSAAVWSRVLALNPARALRRSGIFAVIAGLIVIIHELRGEPHPLIFMIVFAFLQLAVQGLTQGSRTYLVLMAPADARPRYLAVSNAVLGVLAIAFSGMIGVLAHTIHIYWALGVLISLAAVSSAATRLLVPPPDE